MDPTLALLGVNAAAAISNSVGRAISATGDAFADLLRQQPQAPVPSATPVDEPTSLPVDSDQFDAFARSVLTRLAAGGVDLSHPIELSADPGGSPQVTNDHPQRTLIEQLLNTDSELSRRFEQILSKAGQGKLTLQNGNWTLSLTSANSQDEPDSPLVGRNPF